MNIRFLLTVFSLIFLLVVVGCSQEEKSKEEETSKKTETTKSEITTPVEAAQQNHDSLALIIYPVRNNKNQFVTIVTDFGNMVIELYRDVAPAHADSFVERSRDGFYNGTIFHRIIDHFMIQGGDPTGTGMGNTGYYLNAEFSELPHQEGTLSMARSQSPNSASCQFFICLERNRGTQSLDKQYTVFGQLIKGYDVLHKIGSVPVKTNPGNPREQSKPVDDVYLRRAFISDKEGNEL